MFIDNNWWGHKYILAKYCKTKIRPIFGSMQHGAYTLEEERNWTLKKKRNFTFIPYFCYSSFFLNKCKKNQVKNVFAIGSPFIYLDKMMRPIKKKRGTVVFPSHSGFKVKKNFFFNKFLKKKRIFDHNAFIKNVEKFNKPPYTVSIIKDDYDDICDFYKRKNWTIFSAGNRYDKLFLERIYKLLSSNTHAVFCEFTSALFYSMYLRLNVRLAVKSRKSKKIIPFAKNIGNVDKTSFKKYYDKYPKIFSGKFPLAKARDIAMERLGYDCIKSKEDLMRLLGWNSNIKIFLSTILKMLYNIKYKFKN